MSVKSRTAHRLNVVLLEYMSDTPARKRMIENEVLVRAANKKAQRMLKAHTPREEQSGLKIDFSCECSALDCAARVSLTLRRYEQLHQRQDRFVIAIGHESPEVEKVVTANDAFLIVEKYALPA